MWRYPSNPSPKAGRVCSQFLVFQQTHYKATEIRDGNVASRAHVNALQVGAIRDIVSGEVCIQSRIHGRDRGRWCTVLATWAGGRGCFPGSDINRSEGGRWEWQAAIGINIVV